MPTRADDKSRLTITGTHRSGPSESDRREVKLGKLPAEIEAIKAPYVQRVTPVCTQNDLISFIFYVTSRADLTWPQYQSTGEIYILYIDIDTLGTANVYARPLVQPAS